MKLGTGALLVILGLTVPFLLESAETARMADLETQGVIAKATITKLTVSPVQAPRSATVGTYMAMRGFGASRKAALGTALISRSNARSAARAAAATAYYDIEFEFPWAQGQVFLGADHLLIQRTDSLDVGSQISILHDAHDPAIHRLTSYSKPTYHVATALKVFAGVLPVGLGAILLLWGWPAQARSASVPRPVVRREPAMPRVPNRTAAPARRIATAAPAARSLRPASPGAKGFGGRARG